jgi:hypothetical protein
MDHPMMGHGGMACCEGMGHPMGHGGMAGCEGMDHPMGGAPGKKMDCCAGD